jgi:plastocyanin
MCVNFFGFQFRLILNALLSAVLFVAFFSAGSAAAEDELTITIRDHRFTPEELRVPAGKKMKILVKNEDASPEEFESYPLKREKVVSPKGTIALWIGPLKAGTYEYFGDFHPDTAKGRILAEENAS